MYSIILAAAMTTATPAPGFNGFFQRLGCNGCNGCSGCQGVSYEQMSGCSGCMGCNGCSGCNGCCGGGFLGVRSWFRSAFGNNCQGCQGCSGCMGCCGGCNGYSMGCMGTSMSCFGSPMSMSSFPNMPMMGSPMMGSPMMGGMMSDPQMMNPSTPPGPMPSTLQSNEPQATPGTATVVVSLPADARLYIDGQLSPLTGAIRVFRTPALTVDKEFYYTLKMEVDRGGKTQTASETVILQPGKVSRVTFNDPTAGTSAKIQVRMPEGAVLYVEGNVWPLLAGQQSISTPKLEPGRDYFYTLMLETDRGGEKVKVSREVTFRAGANLTVDFDSRLAAGK